MERAPYAKTRSAHDKQRGDAEKEPTYHTPHIDICALRQSFVVAPPPLCAIGRTDRCHSIIVLRAGADIGAGDRWIIAGGGVMTIAPLLIDRGLAQTIDFDPFVGFCPGGAKTYKRRKVS